MAFKNQLTITLADGNQINLVGAKAIKTKIDELIATHNNDVTAHPDLKFVKKVEYDDKTGEVTFTNRDNTVVTFDIFSESIVKNLEYDSKTRELVITRNDGKEVRVSIEDLVDTYDGGETDQTQVVIDINKEITTRIKTASISREFLAEDVTDELDGLHDDVDDLAGKIAIINLQESSTTPGALVFTKGDGSTVEVQGGAPADEDTITSDDMTAYRVLKTPGTLTIGSGPSAIGTFDGSEDVEISFGDIAQQLGLDSKVDKVLTPDIAYTTTSAGVQGSTAVSTAKTANSIAKRQADGTLIVSDAVNATEATTLGQVNTIVEDALTELEDSIFEFGDVVDWSY